MSLRDQMTDDEDITRALTPPVEEQGLTKPLQDTQFANESAKLLMQIVRENGWAKKLGGSSEHLQYEAWQTAGKYYGLTVDTDKTQPEYVEYDGVWGFKAHAEVIDNKTGLRVGGASALCMSDEGNWRNKPKFQLMSMAQTRAGSKALRQILGFVVALAGFNPTPAEEMDGVAVKQNFNNDSQQAIKELKAKKEAIKEDEWIEEVSEAQEKHSEKKEKAISDNLCEKCLLEDKENQVSDKVKNYSLEKYGQVLCFNHQRP